MPHTKEYKGKKGSSASSNKRRPRHEIEDNGEALKAIEAEETVFDGTEDINTEALNEGITAEEAHFQGPDTAVTEETSAQKAYEAAYEEPAPSASEFNQEPQKVHLEFYGSELIRMKAPKVMELADTVADEWVKDGEFQGLPVGNPLAQLAAAKALRTAKDVEKKLEEKGVFVMAKMGLDYLKSKIDKK